MLEFNWNPVKHNARFIYFSPYRRFPWVSEFCYCMLHGRRSLQGSLKITEDQPARKKWPERDLIWSDLIWSDLIWYDMSLFIFFKFSLFFCLKILDRNWLVPFTENYFYIKFWIWTSEIKCWIRICGLDRDGPTGDFIGSRKHTMG